jgi:phospholipid/cholesterol/gamma-HCH transport system permease protein
MRETVAAPFAYQLDPEPDGRWVLRFYGRLDIDTAPKNLRRLSAALNKIRPAVLGIDLSNVTYMDDYGALLISELRSMPMLRGAGIEIDAASPTAAEILNRNGPDSEKRRTRKPLRRRLNLVAELGEATIGILMGMKTFIAFIGSLSLSTVNLIKNPRTLRLEDTIGHMKTTGVDAVPVVALISFLLGLIMAFMSSLQLSQFGANIYVASLVVLAMVSELGPIMTAIVVAGRSGSAYAAEISAMKIAEEIDALTIMGFDPIQFLVIPRMLAAVIVIPLLTIFSNVFAIAGGLFIGVTLLDLTTGSYIQQTINSLKLFEVFWGLSKSLVFAVIIAGAGCFRGFQARGGAAAVGNAATSAVVTCIFLIILFDSLFAVIRSQW